MSPRLAFAGLVLIASLQSMTFGGDGPERTPSDLLVESYRISVGLVPAERAILLNYLSRAAGAQHLPYTASWAEENLRLAHQLSLDWNRVAIEKNAIVALSYVKSKRALDLLRTMSLPVSDGVGFPEDVRADAAITVFQNYWHDRHPRGVPELRATALYLGQTGLPLHGGSAGHYGLDARA